MKFIKLSVNPCSLKEFISSWAQLYNERKYSENIYEEKLIREGILQENNIRALLEWKNGRPLSGKKKPIESKAIQNLEKFNQFRALATVTKDDFNQFWSLLSKVVKTKTKIVIKVFLLHIARPIDYPMVDQHVLRAYYFLTHGEVTEPEETLETYLLYKEFFFNIARDSGKGFRDVDKALMAFGQFLKSQFFQL
ncbi:MAG: hypothetical protein ACTSRC_19125 [Candidatus Helarchaeota archaeon]